MSLKKRPSTKNLILCLDHLSVHILLLRLRKALVQSEEKERALVRCQLELQKSINYKASCLYIDEVVCGQHREALKACQF